MTRLTRDVVVPIKSAEVSRLMVGITFSIVERCHDLFVSSGVPPPVRAH